MRAIADSRARTGARRPVSASEPRRGRTALSRLGLLVLPLIGVLAWQLAAWLSRSPEWLLPAPLDVIEALWADRARLWFHSRATIAAAGLGLVLAALLGTVLAIVISASRIVERAVYPWLIATQAVPLLVLAPLIAIWADYGTAQVVVAFLITFFPVVVTGVDGLRAAQPELARAARTMGAGRLWIWRHVTLPAALPRLFSGLKLAAVFAVTGAAVSEYVGANRGLGYFAEIQSAQFETTSVFAAVVVLAVIGVVFFVVVAGLERLALPYRRRSIRPAWRDR